MSDYQITRLREKLAEAENRREEAGSMDADYWQGREDAFRMALEIAQGEGLREAAKIADELKSS